MSAGTENITGATKIRLKVFADCDDVYLVWRTGNSSKWEQMVNGSVGFMIERQRKNKSGDWDSTEILRNRVGFTDPQMPSNDSEASEEFLTQPSNIWPFQRYDWTDHGANCNEIVRYRVSAVGLPAGGTAGATPLEPVADSGWTESISVQADSGNRVSAYFNRGTVMSQYVARIARLNEWKPKDIKDHIKEIEEPLRRFLSGELRLGLLELLKDVIEDPTLEFYAALFELQDDELINQLCLLRGRAHIVLSNGAAKDGDENEDSRKKLRAKKVDVKDRLLGSKGLGHNKFAIVVKKKNREPVRAWTGSTNWAATGLCTQLNNAVKIEDREVANLFLQQWDRLVEAEDGFPKELVSANAESPRTVDNMDIWFTRIRNTSKKNVDIAKDIQSLIDVVTGAKEMILYVMFQPGTNPLLDILERAKDLYVRGIVSTVTSTNEEEFQLAGVKDEPIVYKTALIQPEGIVKTFSSWIKEVTRAQFLMPFQAPGIGHAITHCKMIVIDPFSDDSVVVTGSHNFSKSASEKNDENFLIIHNDRALAEAYAVACMSTYNHYRWRAYVKEKADAGQSIWSHLSSDPAWQNSYLQSKKLKKHLDLWCPV
jgi:phosphatidylserine/phosphatidylglycerophosphate/cardiolipin synthase-like enzyme